MTIQPFIIELLDEPKHNLIVLAKSYDDVPDRIRQRYGDQIRFEILQCWAGDNSYVFPFSLLIFEGQIMGKKSKTEQKPKAEKPKKKKAN